jgi:hypothetical protein
MFTFAKTSAGERLCEYLYENAIDPGIWDRLESKHLPATGRAAELRLFLQAAIALNLTRRLILIAEGATRFTAPGEPGFLSYLRKPIQKLGLESLDARGALGRLIKDSLVSSRHAISKTLRAHMLSWALANHPRCYLCDTTLTFSLSDTKDRHDITLDHVWPQAYGGDSNEDNLLPACRHCNESRKLDYPLWAACNAHTLNVGHNSSPEVLKSVGGYFKYAVYSRAVFALANREQTTLKRACQILGPWLPENYYIDEDEIGDFFNIATHDYSKTQ